ncbi:MAG: hypothetical protein ACREM6_15725, partial [Vulcanimicrobiaceae bacterium]
GHGLSLGPTPCRLEAVRAHDPDTAKLHALLERYASATGSVRALGILADWPRALERFGKLALTSEESVVTGYRPLVSSP